MSEQNTSTALEHLEGTVEHIIYSNEENGYTICDMSLQDGDIITAVGSMPLIGAGDSLSLYGRWVHNPKYGRQFSVAEYERIMPADVTSILKYLSSRVIKGIGPKTAQRIVDEFGEDTFDVMENHPEWLANIKGISMKMALAASESFREQAGVRSAMMFFRDYFGVTTTLKIYKRFGSRAVDIAKQNPYRLCNEIEGIGFESADIMATSLGFGEDNFDRIMSGINYVLIKNEIASGHTCMPYDALCESASALLGVGTENIKDAIRELLREGGLICAQRGGESLIFRSEMFGAERYIAKKLTQLDRLCASVDIEDIDGFIREEERKGKIEYAALQRKAIADALRFGVMVLTGGPGTGKTTVIRALIRIFDIMGYDIALCAPTGRAAKRMSEATSMEAKTVHRLLEMTYDGGGYKFMRNEENLLDEQVIIVDEASMIDTFLMCALLKAIKNGARLIIIGDSDQLPSVGAGNVLLDIIACERFATVRLTEIFRQTRESLIVTNAHAVNAGQMPALTKKDSDFFFLPRERDGDIAATVSQLCTTRLPRVYGEMGRSGVQVICASKKGEAGTESLNILLQSSLNPRDAKKREHVFRDRVFREGDKVMQIRNNYDIFWERVGGGNGNGIFNGDIGIIESIDERDSAMTVLFDDKQVIYEFSLLEDLEHAYAITVHKSQGSEYPIVIIPACRTSHMLQTRNLLYTAITRAQSMVIIVGREDIVSEMVSNNRQSKRYTGLCAQIESIGESEK